MAWYSCSFIPRRAILGVLSFNACLFSYFLRTNFSIIIVAMVQARKATFGKSYCEREAEGLLSVDPAQTPINATLPDYGERYDWNQNIQGLLLAAYFYGTLPTSIPGGILAEKFGGAKIVAIGTIVPALLNLLMPFAAQAHFSVIFLLRFFMGFFGSIVYPALHAMIARWVPPSERGIFMWTATGGPFGAFVTLSICGVVISDYGWKPAFYVTSFCIFVFWTCWMFLAYDTPDAHPTITDEEKNYIKESLREVSNKQKKRLPVKDIFTSLPFIAALYSHFANMWGVYFISTNGPKYTLEILGFDMRNAGWLTGAPYIFRMLCGAVFATGGDFLRRRGILSLLWLRRSFMIFCKAYTAHVAPSMCMLVATYVGCNKYMAVGMFILALAFNGAACQTNLANHQDLSPNYAGSLYGFMNTVGSFSGFIIPAVIGALTNEHNGLLEWRIMFWISTGVFISATIIFWIFGSTSIQPWNDQDS